VAVIGAGSHTFAIVLSIQNGDDDFFCSPQPFHILANKSARLSIGAKVAAIVKFRRNRGSAPVYPEQSSSAVHFVPSLAISPDRMHAQQNRANLRTWWNNIKGKRDPDFEVPYRRASLPVFESIYSHF
jgi:hypothetical protein